MLTRRASNRTLLQRHHLLARASMPSLDMVEHRLGLQAQDPLPPYLSLRARIAGFDPLDLSGLLERREAVRVLVVRGTIHLVSSADALELRPLVQAMLDEVTRNTPSARCCRRCSCRREACGRGQAAWSTTGWRRGSGRHRRRMR